MMRMKTLGSMRFLCGCALLVFLAVTSFFTLRADLSRRSEKRELIELLNIKYGLFNVDEWRKIVSGALTRKIEEFEVDQNNRKELKSNISTFLTKVIGDLESRYYEQNASNIAGLVKNGIAGLTGTFERIKKDVPVFSEQVIEFLDKPENKKALRSLLISKMDAYAETNLEKVDYTLHDSIVTRLGVTNRGEAISLLQQRGDRHDGTLTRCTLSLTVIFILAAILIVSAEHFARHELLALNGLCLGFLLLGLMLPMIEIDARISEISIGMFGERAEFKNQVLYYKSKSVLEVVWLMMTQGAFGLRCVGGLILCFSVLFPLAKLTSIALMQFNATLKARRSLQWLVRESGKWSMADVMVVAIFMSYIGFSGILSEQLKQLENFGSSVEILTTNQSRLQTGFFAFTGFALLSMLLSRSVSILERRQGTPSSGG
jgi:hypothetical protein